MGATSLGRDLASSVKAEHIVSVVTKFLEMTGWLINNRKLFLTVPEAGKSGSRGWWIWCLVQARHNL